MWWETVVSLRGFTCDSWTVLHGLLLVAVLTKHRLPIYSAQEKVIGNDFLFAFGHYVNIKSVGEKASCSAYRWVRDMGLAQYCLSFLSATSHVIFTRHFHSKTKCVFEHKKLSKFLCMKPTDPFVAMLHENALISRRLDALNCPETTAFLQSCQLLYSNFAEKNVPHRWIVKPLYPSLQQV